METKVNELNKNLKDVMVLATEVAKNKKYVIKVDGEEQSHLEFINFKIDHLTQSGRKKLARRIFVINKKRGQNLAITKNINDGMETMEQQK